MTLVRNPFDAGGYSLAEMTQAINILPNLYTRLAQIGLFRFEGSASARSSSSSMKASSAFCPPSPSAAPPPLARARAARCAALLCRGSRMTT